MQARTLARLQALGRVAIGTGLTAAPPRLVTGAAGSDATRAGTLVLTAALGARDLGLGLGTVRALRQGFGARPWLLAGALADGVDCAATLRNRRDLPAAGVAAMVVVAGGSTVLGLWLQTQLD